MGWNGIYAHIYDSVGVKISPKWCQVSLKNIRFPGRVLLLLLLADQELNF